MPKTITVKEAKEALKYLKTLVPANPKLDDDLAMSIKEAVTFMAPDLAQFSRRGFTHKELADGLSSRGIAIKSGTLKRYLGEYMAAKNGTEKSETAMKSDDSKKKISENEARRGALKSPKPVSENPKLYGVAADKKSDSTLSNQERKDV